MGVCESHVSPLSFSSGLLFLHKKSISSECLFSSHFVE